MSIQLVVPSIDDNSPLSRSIESGEQAMRRANGYLTKFIGIHFNATNPELILMDTPIWQVMVSFKIPGLAPFRVGFLDVDKITGDVVAVADITKQYWIDRANAFLESNASSAAQPERLP